MRQIYVLIALLLAGCTALPGQDEAQLSVHTQYVLDSIPVAYASAGEGKETILFIHGLGGTRKHWQQNMPALSRNYRTIAVDLPGYGDSKLPEVPEGNLLQFFSKSLLALMDSLSIRKAHVAGHSMGGQVAMLLAFEHPERVQKLILAAPAGLETFTEAESAGLKQYAAATFPVVQPEKQIRENFLLNFYQIPEQAEMLIQDRLRLNESSDYSMYAKVLTAGVEGMLHMPVASRLSELKSPVLIVFGKEDKLIPNRYLHPSLTTEEVAKVGQQAIPESRLAWIPEAGHLLMFEKPEAFNKIALNFLKNTNTKTK